MVAPLIVAKAGIALVSMIGSIISFLIILVKFIICYTIFFVIVFLIGLNFFNLVGGFTLFDWLARVLDATADCLPVAPT